MNKHDVLFMPTQNETKASVSERAIKTIKMRIIRYLNYKDDYNYLPVLQDIADSYNKTYHRTIGMSPADVKNRKEEEVRLSTYMSQNPKNSEMRIKLKPYKFKVGDHVRISHLRNIFSREYDETYTGEVFKIWRRYHRGTLPVYRLQDLAGEEITGSFYQSELQKIDYNPNQIFKIEKVLKTRGKGRNKQYYIRWKFYPKKYDSWVKAQDIQ